MNYGLVDAHCHPTHKSPGELGHLFSRMVALRVEKILIPGVDVEEYPEIRNQFSKIDKGKKEVFFALGMHPQWSAAWLQGFHTNTPYFGKSNVSLSSHPWLTIAKNILNDEVRQVLCKCDAPAAWGEVGLDKQGPQWLPWLQEVEPNLPTLWFEWQKMVLELWIEWAAKSNKPIIFHNRGFAGPSLEIWERTHKIHPQLKFQWHSFGGSLPVAQRIIRANGYVSILFSMTTPKNASTLKWIWENAKHRLLLESDSPYQMSWENLPILYEQVATILNISLETLEVQMNHNLSEFLNGGNFLLQ